MMPDENPWERTTATATNEAGGSEPWERDEPSAGPSTTPGGAAKSLASGAAEGVLGMIGLPGNVQKFIQEHSPFEWLIDKARGISPEQIEAEKEKARKAQEGSFSHALDLPMSAGMQKGVEKVTGQFYEPKTQVEKYFHNIGEFAPGMLMGPGGLASRGAQAVLGGVGSEAAGEATEGTAWEFPARFLGGIVGGGVGGIFAERASQHLEDVEKVMGAYDRLGLRPTAATAGVGGQVVKNLEGNVLPETIGGADKIYQTHTGNFESLVERQQEIAHKFGSPEVSKAKAGERLSAVVTQNWEGAKKQFGRVLNDIGNYFKPDEFFDAPNFLKAVENPVGAVKRAEPVLQPTKTPSFSIPMMDLIGGSEKKMIEDFSRQQAVDRASQVPRNVARESLAAATKSRQVAHEQTIDPFVKEAAEMLQANNGKLPFDYMKAFATRYGNAVDRKFAANVNDAQISQLQSALRKDMELAIKTRPPEVLQKWEQARSGYAKNMQDYRTAFKKLLGNGNVPMNGEKVYDIFTGAASTGARGDIRMFEKIWERLDKSQRGDISSFVLSRLGNIDPSKVGDLTGWSLGKFLGGYAKLSPEAKQMLFKSTGNADLERALDDLMTVAQSMTVTEKIASSSRSGRTGAYTTQLMAPIIATFTGGIVSGALMGLTTMAGPYVAAQILTNPTAVRALAKSLHQIHVATSAAAKTMVPLTTQELAKPDDE